MTNRSLHIVSLDVPYPADYGGVIDIFYKIKSLKEEGVDVHLHCFAYGERGEQQELEQYCKTVHYYARKTGLASNLSLTPYITYSRRSRELLDNLNADRFPILFEGIHSVYVLLRRQLGDRVLLLRSHNIEHDYYQHLANREPDVVKRLFFQVEAYRLKRLLTKLPPDLPIAAISPADTNYLQGQFVNTFWLPPFHSNAAVETLPGRGDYALYHGNLSVSENQEVAEMLIASFKNREIRLIIAGKAPSGGLRQSAERSTNIRLIADPEASQMDALLRHAHVILLPTFQPTGIKLKLIESLYRGRFCVANRMMVANTRLEDLVTVEEDDFYACTERLMRRSVSAADIERRRRTLDVHYNNARNARAIMEKVNPPV